MPHFNCIRSALIRALTLSILTCAGSAGGEEPTVTLDEEWLRPTASRSFRHEKTLFRWAGQGPGEPGRSEKIITDRPHVSEASNLVGLGTAQLETGYSYFHDRSNGVTTETHSFGEPLLRLGIFAEWFEFRLANTYLMERVRDPVNGNTRVRGFDDLYIGAKLGLTLQDGIFPEMALFPQLRVPLGHEYFTAGECLPGYLFAYSWTINDWLELECNNQANRRIDDSSHTYVELIQTFNFEVTLSDRWGSFYEFLMFMPSGALTARTEYYFHTGFVFLATDNMQFDVHSSVGLNDAADDLAFTGVGWSVRY